MSTDHPLADQLAAEWSALDPSAVPICVQCGKYFHLSGLGGAPSVTCPHCGFRPGEERCRDALAALEERRKAAAVVVADPVEQADSSKAPPVAGLDDVIGNAAAVLQIRTALDAHRARGGKGPFPHLLLAGVGGTGKTMLAEIIAREVGRPIRLQMGQSLNTPSRVADVLRSLKAGDVLFVDEIHGLKPACQETLYRAMEDGLLVPITRAGKPVSAPLKLPPFTLIGSTTDEWCLLPSFLQRFKYRVRLERMAPGELAQAITQRAAGRGWTLTADAAGMIAHRAHGTPRLALGLLDGCMDVALAGGETSIDAMIVQATCEVWGIDGLGLDKVARKYLGYLSDAGGPVRLNVLAMKLDGLSRRTVEMRVEPDLVWLGLIEKDASGRRLTAAGREHLKGTR